MPDLARAVVAFAAALAPAASTFLHAEPPMTTPPNASAPHRNRLALETSPYLLQHAGNPVDWYPWGGEAFETARRLDRPIFLSIGYSTCYWCHVMERESFEDEATAEVLNARFISIKVDREERPDVDEIYMTACQVFTQLTEGRASGGWPLSVFIDPHTLHPFFVGTYFPPRPAYGRPSFTQVVEALADSWQGRRDEVNEQGQRLAEVVAQQLSEPAPPRALGQNTVDDAVNTLMSALDRTNGGFGGAPKFPQPVYLRLLVNAGWERDAVRQAVQRTADGMATGGIHDQIGGGFHRYSVDAKWLVPHFEKMLYDNGQLASFYAELVSRTGDAYYARVLRDTLDWSLREMRSPSGGFFSALDAEVGGREGANYVWTAEEVKAALEDAGQGDLVPLAFAALGIDGGPNFRDPHHPDAGPVSVLCLPARPDALAATLDLDEATLLLRLDAVRTTLLAVRNARPQPRLDDKILAGWNGLMIRGLADGGRVLGEPRYVDAAAQAADFILATLRAADGGLLRVHRLDASRIPAFLEDYALLAEGLLALHRATGAPRWLDEARSLVVQATRRFRNEAAGGGYFDTPPDQPDLFIRARTVNDGAVPGGSTTMLNVLLDLHEATGEPSDLDQAVEDIAAMSGEIARNPVGAALGTLAVLRMARRCPERLPAGAPTAGPDEIGIETAPSRLVVVGEHPLAFSLAIAVPPDLHINAHEPAEPELVGLRLELVDGDGLDLDVRYPSGSTHHGAPGTLAGTVRVEGTLRRTGEVTGRPALLLTYQACTATACRAPERRTVPIAIEGQ